MPKIILLSDRLVHNVCQDAIVFANACQSDFEFYLVPQIIADDSVFNKASAEVTDILECLENLKHQYGYAEDDLVFAFYNGILMASSAGLSNLFCAGSRYDETHPCTGVISLQYLDWKVLEEKYSYEVQKHSILHLLICGIIGSYTHLTAHKDIGCLLDLNVDITSFNLKLQKGYYLCSKREFDCFDKMNKEKYGKSILRLCNAFKSSKEVTNVSNYSSDKIVINNDNFQETINIAQKQSQVEPKKIKLELSHKIALLSLCVAIIVLLFGNNILGKLTNKTNVEYSIAKDKVQNSIETYLKANLKTPLAYRPVSFDSLITFKKPDTLLTTGKLIYHVMLHRYRTKNSEGVEVPMTVAFAFDEDMNILETGPTSIDGDYSSIKGTVAFGGYNPNEQKPDFNAEIHFFPTDTFRKAFVFETTTDMQGNYFLEKILPGQYIVVLRSGNLPFCPTFFIFSGQEFKRGSYSQIPELINQLWGFDYRKLEGFRKIEDKEISTNQIIAQLTGERTAESDSLREKRYRARIGFDQECFDFYKSFQSKLPPVFYQTHLKYSKALQFGFVNVKEEKGQTRNFFISDTCY